MNKFRAFIFFTLGLLAIFSPIFFITSLKSLLSYILIISGFVRFYHFLKKPKRNVFLFALIDLNLGILLFYENALVTQAIVLMIAAAIIYSGGLILQTPRKTRLNKLISFFIGLLTISFGVLFAFNPQKHLASLAIIVGIQLLNVAWILAKIPILPKLNSNYSRRIKGRSYAGYFGGGFHFGIYIGNGKIIHFTKSKNIHIALWKDFAKNRRIERWDYPDLPKIDKKIIVKTAINLLNSKPKYNILKNNCEHFVIYCLSGGLTKKSKYDQASAFEAIHKKSPILASVVEVYSRFIEKLAFYFSGLFGAKFAAKIRNISNSITWSIINNIQK